MSRCYCPPIDESREEEVDEEEHLVEGVCCARPAWYSGLCAEEENARLVALARAQREAVGDGVAREANDASRGAARARGAVAGGAAAAGGVGQPAAVRLARWCAARRARAAAGGSARASMRASAALAAVTGRPAL